MNELCFDALLPDEMARRIEAEDLKAIGKIIYKYIQPIPGVIETITCLTVDPDEA